MLATIAAVKEIATGVQRSSYMVSSHCLYKLDSHLNKASSTGYYRLMVSERLLKSTPFPRPTRDDIASEELTRDLGATNI